MCMVDQHAGRTRWTDVWDVHGRPTCGHTQQTDMWTYMADRQADVHSGPTYTADGCMSADDPGSEGTGTGGKACRTKRVVISEEDEEGQDKEEEDEVDGEEEDEVDEEEEDEVDELKEDEEEDELEYMDVDVDEDDAMVL